MDMSKFSSEELKNDLAGMKMESLALTKLYPEPDESTLKGINVAYILEQNSQAIGIIEAELKRRDENAA